MNKIRPIGSIRRISPITLAALLALPRVAGAARSVVAIPLNDHTRLGQRFTAAAAFEALSVTVPSWLDAEGGLTLTLWDSPQRKRAFARRAFVNIRDNAWIELRLARPLPAGTYYWEVSERTGKTRIGLWADILPNPTEDCAYLDGKPDRKKRFRFRTTPTAFPYASTRQMLDVLKSDAPAATRIEAARQLAAMGDPDAVPELAKLLADKKRSHLARLALQAMPGPAAANALRDAARRLEGALRIGVINSIGERRDAEAVGLLRGLLNDADPAVARTAAAALGKIATPAAADALEAATATAARGAAQRGLIDCARRLAARGQRARAAALYVALLAQKTAPAVRAAALRGAILARGEAGLPLLLKQLRSDDPAAARVALWMVARDLPGAKVTRSLAAELPNLPPEKQAQLVRALCSRGDAAALPALLEAAIIGRKNVRLAALRGLPQLPHPAASAALVEMLSDPDPDIANAAQRALTALRDAGADDALARAVRRGPKTARVRAIRILAARRAYAARPALLDAARSDDAETRLAALKALKTLARPEDVEPLLSFLLKATSTQEMTAAKRALLAASREMNDPRALVTQLVAALPKARPELKKTILRLLHHFGGREAGRAVLAALNDPDPGVRAAAQRLLAEWKSCELAPALLRLAAASENARQRALCLRAYLCLAGRPTISEEDRLYMCRLAAPLAKRPEEKKLLLSALSRLSASEAATLAAADLNDPATRREAAAAILAIAQKRRGRYDAPLLQALQQAARRCGDAALASRAQALLRKQSRGKR